MNLSRRQFTKSALAWGAFGTTFMGYLGRQVHAAGATGNKRLLFIFQRGGNDGVNTVIPHGDSHYNDVTRPTLFIDPADALDLGNSFASLHPMMAAMMPIYTDSQLAVIHRVGYARQSRSHFDSQDYWEKGVPRNESITDGMLYRQLDEMLNLSDPSNIFPAAAISGSQMASLTGAQPLPNFDNSTQFNFLGSSDARTKFLGKVPSTYGAGDGEGMLGLYGDTPLANSFYAQTVNGTGKALGETIGTLATANSTPYVPENGAAYPTGSFGNKLREAAMLFKRTDVSVLGVNIGGWDTHSNQGAIYGNQGNILQNVAEGFRALHLDLTAPDNNLWDDTIIITMTEFGRTSKENGSFGTDHAEASAMFVAGGCVNGGVYNCDSSTWDTGPTEQESSLFQVSQRYLSHRTDFRAIFGEIFMKHFGDTRPQLDNVIPGYTEAEIAATMASSPTMTQLGIM